MASLNKVMLIGRLGKDPEMTRTDGGLVIAKFSVATSDTWKDKNTNEKKEATEWHNIVCFNESTSKFAEQYVKKGDLVYVEGKLVTRSWEKDGVKRYSTEIHIQGPGGKLDRYGGKGEGGGGGSRDYDQEYADRGGRPSSGGQSGSSSGGFGGGGGRASSHLDDDIPFAPEWR